MDKDLARQFSAFLFFPSADINTEIKGELVEAGYESYVFVDQETLIARIKEAAPHVVAFSVEALLTPLSEFVSDILKLNSEIQFVCVAPFEQTEALMEYREYNFAHYVPEGAKLSHRVFWAIDKTCEALYQGYQNEGLIEELEKHQEKSKQFETKLSDLESSMQDSPTQVEVPIGSHAFSVATELALIKIGSKEEMIWSFLSHLPCRGIFFKFLPTVQSFVATQAHGLDIDDIKGVGSRLTQEEARDLDQLLQKKSLPKVLDELMKDGLRVPSYQSHVLRVQRHLEGLFVFWGLEAEGAAQVENSLLIFQLAYENFALAKRMEGLDIFDSTTELYNRNHYLKKIEEEMARARRLQKPVAIVRWSLDHLTEIEQSFGRSNKDLILRAVANMVKKTSRVNDIACRLDDNEFALILPHCGRKGAALRSERLRRIVENHSFALNDLKVTISCGVSEYPSLASGGEDLNLSASKALEFIVGKGGNKVCLYKPDEEFKPDFEVSS